MDCNAIKVYLVAFSVGQRWRINKLGRGLVSNHFRYTTGFV